jgi:hypothetical protein
MLLTIIQYSKQKGVPPRTVYGYVYRGLLPVSNIIGGIKFIDDKTELPKVHNGWVKGKPRKKQKTDLDLLG